MASNEVGVTAAGRGLITVTDVDYYELHQGTYVVLLNSSISLFNLFHNSITFFVQVAMFHGDL